MGRPKAENPRSVRLVVKLTADEKATIDAAAGTTGLSVSEYVRTRAIALRPGLLERTEPGSGPAASNEAAKEEPAPERMPDRRDPAAWWCPRPLCQKRSNDKGALCPTHGVPMTMKGAG